METPNDRIEAYKGIILIGCLLVMVVVMDPVLLWFTYSLAGTFWGFYSAWWLVVMLFLTGVTARHLLKDDQRKVGR